MTQKLFPRLVVRLHDLEPWKKTGWSMINDKAGRKKVSQSLLLIVPRSAPGGP